MNITFKCENGQLKLTDLERLPETNDLNEIIDEVNDLCIGKLKKIIIEI